MNETSEATRRVFERALQNLKGKFSPEVIEALRDLLEAGKLSDVLAVEDVVKSQRCGDGD